MSAERTPRPELAAFAARLRGKMRARHLSVNELARRIKSSGSGVGEWTRALRAPRLETLRRLAAEFDEPVEDWETLLPDALIAEPVPGVVLVPVDADLEARIDAALARERQRAAAGAESVGDDGDPVRVREPGLVWRGTPIPVGALVWLTPATTAEPGDVVRVGYAEPARLAVYGPEHPVEVTAVGWLIQIRIRR